MSLEATNAINRWYLGWSDIKPVYSQKELEHINKSFWGRVKYVRSISKDTIVGWMRPISPIEMYYFDSQSPALTWYLTFSYFWKSERHDQHDCRFKDIHQQRKSELWRYATESFLLNNSGGKELQEDLLTFFKKITYHENIFLQSL